MENIISGVNQECFESCVFNLYIVMLGQGTRYSNDTASLLPKLTHLAEANIPSGLSYCCLMQPSGGQYHYKSCSLSPLISGFILQPTMNLFLQSGLFKWYMKYHFLVQGEQYRVSQNYVNTDIRAEYGQWYHLFPSKCVSGL